jgi:excisionase family DNA binding protein
MTERPEIITASVKMLSQMSSLSRSKIYELIKAGALRTVKLGRRRLILVESYREYLTQLATPNPTHKEKRAAGVHRRTRVDTNAQISLVRND